MQRTKKIRYRRNIIENDLCTAVRLKGTWLYPITRLRSSFKLDASTRSGLDELKKP